MAWPNNKLSEVAEMVADAIEETLASKFYVQGKEYDTDDEMIFTIAQCGDKFLAVKFKLSISADYIMKAFWDGLIE